MSIFEINNAHSFSIQRIGGLLGGFVLIVWLIVVDGIMGFKRSIEMNQFPNERIVYEFLKEYVTEPARFICNPEVKPNRRFPGDDPILAVHYTGLGHDDSLQEMILGLLIMLLAPIIGAWLLLECFESNSITISIKSFILCVHWDCRGIVRYHG